MMKNKTRFGYDRMKKSYLASSERRADDYERISTVSNQPRLRRYASQQVTLELRMTLPIDRF
jgi:hypothetical protein